MAPSGPELVLLGTLGSLAAGSATALGAAAVFLVRRMTPRLEDTLLGLAAGIMLAATFFSLLVPGIAIARTQLGSALGAALLVGSGVLVGALVLWLLHRFAPHEHLHRGREGPDAPKVARVWLFVVAITLHNLPEGMAVGVGFGAGPLADGVALALGIGLQNVPEGLAVAASLVAIGETRRRSFAVGALTGLVEPLGGLLGASAVWLARPALPWTLGFAAGAMLFVISDEIVPETHRRGFETQATFALLAGFVLMMVLDASLAQPA